AVLVLLSCASLAAQDKVNIYQPPQSDPHDVRILSWPPSSVPPTVRNRSEMPVTRINPTRPVSLEELKASVHRLQVVNAELQSIKSRTDADIENIARHALEIHELAVYLKAGLGLGRANQPNSPEAEAKPLAAPLNREISAIDHSINEFVNNPVSEQPRTV